MIMEKVKVMVFDLDGTLYSDTHHFDYYATRLMERLPKKDKQPFMNDYHLARENHHVIKVGRVYDVKRDLVLIARDNIVSEAFDWTGLRWPADRVEMLYPEPITIDNVRMLSIGDLWWVPVPIARHYGLDRESSHEAFIETRDFMMRPDFKLNRIPGLQETLEALHGNKKIILLTNSPEPDSRAILAKLGLTHVFHKYIFGGKKPTRTVSHFEKIKEEFQVDYEEILSVGDNWVNEIYPVQKLGVKTLFINAYQLSAEHGADFIVKRMEDGLPILKEI